MNPQDLIFIPFFFALGACVGSFLNVVVWRLPRDESLISPPSHCPKCNHKLAWRDNIPVFGWMMLGGKCRYCANPISPRYPIVEAITGLLFVAYYICFFILQIGPCPQVANAMEPIFGLPVIRPMAIQQDWPIYLLYMFLLSALLAASLIDAELFIIPLSIPMWAAGVGLVVHAIIDHPRMAGALNASPPAAALAIGGGLGLLISIILVRLSILPASFEQAETVFGVTIQKQKEILRAIKSQFPAGESKLSPIERRRLHRKIGRRFVRAARPHMRRHMSKEMLFLMLPLVLGGGLVLLTLKIPALSIAWSRFVTGHDWFSGFCGALLGGLVGGFTVWFTRIISSIFFGREAMGLGDVDLMFGVGTVLGPGAVVIAFFLAPFCGIGIAVYKLVTGKGRELPYGPYLSIGAALTMLFYCPIAAYFTPGLSFLAGRMREWIGL